MNNKEEKEEKNKAFQEIRRRNVNLGNMSCIAKKFYTYIICPIRMPEPSCVKNNMMFCIVGT